LAESRWLLIDLSQLLLGINAAAGVALARLPAA
jgi:hypothetical protein